MALSDRFETLIKPELRDEFELDKIYWFPRTDTTENKIYDKRKRGLFKIEYEGDGMVALCSKTLGEMKTNFPARVFRRS